MKTTEIISAIHPPTSESAWRTTIQHRNGDKIVFASQWGFVWDRDGIETGWCPVCAGKVWEEHNGAGKWGTTSPDCSHPNHYHHSKDALCSECWALREKTLALQVEITAKVREIEAMVETIAKRP